MITGYLNLFFISFSYIYNSNVAIPTVFID
jgi:hypothetical protein